MAISASDDRVAMMCMSMTMANELMDTQDDSVVLEYLKNQQILRRRELRSNVDTMLAMRYGIAVITHCDIPMELRAQVCAAIKDDYQGCLEEFGFIEQRMHGTTRQFKYMTDEYEPITLTEEMQLHHFPYDFVKHVLFYRVLNRKSHVFYKMKRK